MAYIINQRDRSAYLKELSILTGSDVSIHDLSTLEEMESVRAESREINDKPISRFSIDFKCRCDEKFINYIKKLHLSDNGEIYIWTERTNLFGLYKIKSMIYIITSFPFELNEEGIVVFLTINLKNKLLFDFSIVNNNKIL